MTNVSAIADERGEVRPQLRRAERAIEPDRQRPRVADRCPEGLDRVAREVAAGKVGEGHRDHQRQLAAERLLRLERRHDRGLGVQRVEHGLDQDEVDAAVDQRVDLLAIDGLDLVEVDLADSRDR